MALSEGQSLVRAFAGTLGMLQGITWSFMALAYLVLHYGTHKTVEVNSYMGSINNRIYNFFINNEGNTSSFRGQILNPYYFSAFVWIHFGLNLFWVANSIRVVRQDGAKLVRGLKCWSHITCVVCVWDLINVILMGVDYDNCMRQVSPYGRIQGQEGCANGILPVLVVTGKGFVLWIINAVFARLLYKLSKRLEKMPMGDPPVDFLQPPPPYSPPEYDGIHVY